MYEDCLTALGKAYNPAKIKGPVISPPFFSSPSVLSFTSSDGLYRSLTYPTDGEFGAMMQVASTNDVRRTPSSLAIRLFPASKFRLQLHHKLIPPPHRYRDR
jgi:hypothetical protein